MPSITVRDHDHWKSLRREHVGGSEVGALFDAHRHMSRYELWLIKAGRIPAPNLDDDERVFWGQTIEPAIAWGIAKKYGWNIQKVHRYIEDDDEPGLGCSLDFEITNHDRGPGVLEIKNVDRLVRRSWPDGEPPLDMQLQVQTGMAVTRRSWGALGCLIGGNTLEVYIYSANERVALAIRTHARKFWRSIEAGEMPKPDFSKDLSAILALTPSASTGFEDMSDDTRLAELCARHVSLSAEVKAMNDERDAIKAEVAHMVGATGTVLANGHRVRNTNVAGQDVSYYRKPYRQISIEERDE